MPRPEPRFLKFGTVSDWFFREDVNKSNVHPTQKYIAFALELLLHQNKKSVRFGLTWCGMVHFPELSLNGSENRMKTGSAPKMPSRQKQKRKWAGVQGRALRSSAPFLPGSLSAHTRRRMQSPATSHGLCDSTPSLKLSCDSYVKDFSVTSVMSDCLF